MPDAELRLVDLLADKMKREQRPISVAEVARQCGMSRQNADKWFQNKIKCPPLRTIALLCVYFDCTPSDLIVLRKDRVS
jgi:DNA-binding Xre family transcriptional regulator